LFLILIDISKLIRKCWNSDPDRRPSFEECFTQINSIAMSIPENKFPILMEEGSSDNIISKNNSNQKNDIKEEI
jgi:hypothetical protein